MEVLSVLRGARISAFKARELTREIQGLPASAALDLVAFSSKKAALMVGKTLKSAIANAENNNDLKVETLVVKEATVGEGPTMKRIKSRARGSASPIAKRTAHIRIVLTDDIVIPQRAKPTGAKKRKTNLAKTPAKVVATNTPATPILAAAEVVEAAPSTIETETPATSASQKDEGPGETPAAPKVSSDEDVTKD